MTALISLNPCEVVRTVSPHCVHEEMEALGSYGMCPGSQSVKGEAGMELHVSDLRDLVLSHCVCFSEQGGGAFGDQEESLDCQTGNNALEFLNGVDCLSHDINDELHVMLPACQTVRGGGAPWLTWPR